MGGNICLKDLTMEQKQEAFNKTLKTFDEWRKNDEMLANVKLVLITEDFYETALKFARDNFVPKEPMNKSLGVQWDDELEEFWLASFKLNLSLLFINEDNNEPMALRTTRIAKSDDNSKIVLESIQNEALKVLLRACIYADQEADFFGHFGIQESFHFLGLAVAEKYKHRGLASHIFNAALDMILNFGIEPVYVKVEGSSNFSKRIFENAGFETLYELIFDEYTVDGKCPIQNTGIHKSMKVYGKKLDAKT